MPSNVVSNVENNFTKGLITEFTGFNFPENAATDTDNCIYTLVGNVTRRLGIDFEENFQQNPVVITGAAINSYKWNNAGGNGVNQILVQQVGGFLLFYNSAAATIATPLSKQNIITIGLAQFAVTGTTFDISAECQFSDGNGYLIVYHPSMDPIFCTYSGGSIQTFAINIYIRDFTGISEASAAVNTRPVSLNNEHLYNLINQGWVKGAPWTANSSSSVLVSTGSKTFVVPAGLSITIGDRVGITNNIDAFPGGNFQPAYGQLVMGGTVTGYSGTNLIVNVNGADTLWAGSSSAGWFITPYSVGYIDTFFTATGVYPSNADVWWYFKNAGGIFDPATTSGNVSLSAGSAPKGHVLLKAFIQDRSTTSGVSSLTSVETTVRPRTGCWFQGRVWYAGVDAQQAASGDASYYSWTENIYFSKIVETVEDFGKCYQTNDPSSETLFDLLPIDGGVIKIVGCGSIYKLFPIQNALLVFAANGVWYITGSQGIGFTANDYTIVKLSSVRSLSGTSFVDINGLPMFWNEEGIYSVEPAKQGGGLQGNPLHVNPLEVNALTVGTILSFYNSIPLQSKKFARGAYNPIDYTVQWVFKSTSETGVDDRYSYDRVLNLNVYNKAFYPYSLTLNSTVPRISGIFYMNSFGGTGTVDSVIKYIIAQPFAVDGGVIAFTFGEERDDTFVDWRTAVPTNYESFFITGYKLHGQGQHRFQIPYLYMYSQADSPTSYKLQGIWDYASTGDSGRWTLAQLVNSWTPNFRNSIRRHRIRGRGLVFQLKIASVDGEPFDILGWSAYENMNTGV